MTSLAHRIPLVALALSLSGCAAAEKLVSSATGGGGSCNGPTPLTASGSVSGSTNGVSCKMPDGSKGNVYTFAPTQPTAVELNLTSSGFTPYFGAWTSTGALIGQTNTAPYRFRLFLGAGSYQFGVSAVSGDGSFTLSSAPVGQSGCSSGPGTSGSFADMGFATRGAVITGALNSADCGGGGGRADGYTVGGATANSSWSFTVTLDRAANFEVYAGSQTLAVKSLNAAGTATVTVTAPSPTDFRFFITGTPGTGAINYTVTVN